MCRRLFVSASLVVISACSSTKNVSLKHSDPAMVAPARFEQELADCRAWATGAAPGDALEGKNQGLPADMVEYAIYVCLRGKGYSQVNEDGERISDAPVIPTLSVVWSRSGTAEVTAYNDGRECQMTANINASATQPESFRAYWDSYLSSLNSCMRRKGYQCTGRDCR